MSKIKLNKVELKNVKNVGVLVVEKVDNRKNNPGRPVNKQSARYKRLAKQSFYTSQLSKFQKGNQFEYKSCKYTAFILYVSLIFKFLNLESFGLDCCLSATSSSALT